MNAFWRHLFPSHEQSVTQILEFWRNHIEEANTNITWEAFKAMLRGIFIREIQVIKHNTNAQREDMERLAGDSEKAFAENPTDSNKKAWLDAQEALNR